MNNITGRQPPNMGSENVWGCAHQGPVCVMGSILVLMSFDFLGSGLRDDVPDGHSDVCDMLYDSCNFSHPIQRRCARSRRGLTPRS